MPTPRPTLVWGVRRNCSHTAELDGCGRWHACGPGWHRELREGVHLLVRPVDKVFQARIEDESGEALTADGANFTEWEYADLSRARLRVEAQAMRVMMEKGIVKR